MLQTTNCTSNYMNLNSPASPPRRIVVHPLLTLKQTSARQSTSPLSTARTHPAPPIPAALTTCVVPSFLRPLVEVTHSTIRRLRLPLARSALCMISSHYSSPGPPFVTFTCFTHPPPSQNRRAPYCGPNLPGTLLPAVLGAGKVPLRHFSQLGDLRRKKAGRRPFRQTTVMPTDRRAEFTGMHARPT